ncbi:MAG: hypothetical protein EPN63_01640 [Nevskiaceae bacterium]|nr:MAG: hypothetical protein EPN63_01640 [Nevskiaceae bacterium]
MKSHSRLLALGLIFVTALTLAACATPEYRIRNHPDIYAQATPAQQALIGKGQIGLGFKPEFVRLALGRPDRVSQRTDADGTEVVWHYAAPQSTVVWTTGFGYPFYDPFFGPNIIAVPTAGNDRLSVTFRNNTVVSIDETVHP